MRLEISMGLEAVSSWADMVGRDKIDKRRGDFWGLGEVWVRVNPPCYAVVAQITINLIHFNVPKGRLV